MLIVAHGSRRAASNQEIESLTANVRNVAGDSFAHIDCAFLELAEPSIPAGIEALVKQGATDILVVPYFLAAGTHVTEDIPGIVEQAQKQFPDIALRTTDYLGSNPGMAKLLLGLARNTE